MKIASIFVSTFVIFDVFQHSNARFLLVEVEGTERPIDIPPKDWSPWDPLGAEPTSRCGGARVGGACPSCCYPTPTCFCCVNCPKIKGTENVGGNQNRGRGLLDKFKDVIGMSPQKKCARWQKNDNVKENCMKQTNKQKFPCCKNMRNGANNDDENGQNEVGGDANCQEKTGKEKKCRAKINKWIDQNKLSRKCDELIAKEKRKGKQKKCSCTCKKEMAKNGGGEEDEGGNGEGGNDEGGNGEDDNPNGGADGDDENGGDEGEQEPEDDY